MAHGKYRLETRLIHGGELSPRVHGAVNTPIYQSSTFEYAGEGSYHDVRYLRLNNTPNHAALHAQLRSLEGAEAALVTASGMAAISAALLSVLSQGDHLLVQNGPYGGTHSFITGDLQRLGITSTSVDATAPSSWREHLRPNTRAIYVETMSNPLLQLADYEAVAGFARKEGLVSLIDNTLATPLNFRPSEHGFDLSLHSCSKYLNGHSDIVAGAVLGRKERVDSVKHRLDHLGGSLDPHACFLLSRGIKTLALRLRAQSQSALELARFLEKHPAIKQVNYPGLESHPQHARARRLFECFGGLLSFEPHGGLEAAERLLARVRLPIKAPSLGGVETLITRPAATSHAGLAAADRARFGISEELVRLSVGIEATQDLRDDLAQALEA